MAETYSLYEGAFGRAIVLEPQADLVAHSHSETQLAFWLGGVPARARIGAQVVQYGENTALAANAYESHDMTLLDSGSCVFLCFMVSRQWLDRRRALTGRPFVFPSPQVPLSPALIQACWRVLDLITSVHSGRQDIDVEVEQLLVAAINSSTEQSGLESLRAAMQGIGSALDHRLRAAIVYMRENVAEKITVEEVAARVGLSRAHFFALFREQLNTTPQVFWSAVRVEEAMRRMDFDREGVTRLALDLGFSAPGNFSRFFKEHTGVSPSIYRRAAGNIAISPRSTATG